VDAFHWLAEQELVFDCVVTLTDALCALLPAPSFAVTVKLYVVDAERPVTVYDVPLLTVATAVLPL
jgi:hypothetical protein